MAKRYSEQQWRDWFDEFERSGLTVAKFCETIGVCVVTFYRWRRKLNRAVSKGLGQGKLIVAGGPFVSVSCSSPVIEFEFPGQAIARVPNDAESLRPLIQVLIDEGVPS
jgi:transposase-like protein